MLRDPGPLSVEEDPRPDPRPARAADRPLRVAYVSPAWPTDGASNGVATYAATLAEALGRLGHHPAVMAWSRGAGRTDEQGPLVRFLDEPLTGPVDRAVDAALRRLSPWAALERRSLARLTRGVRALADGPGLDLVEIEEAMGLAAGLPDRVPVPVVVRLHGPWFLVGPADGRPEDADLRRRVRREGRLITEAAAVSAPSIFVLDRARAHYGLALEGAEVIPNPVPSPSQSARWRPEECEPGLVLFVGRFDRVKGADVLVRAFARVLAARPGARLELVGPGDGLEDDQGRRWSSEAYLDDQLPGARAAGRVRWLGPRPRGELDELRRRASVCVVASRFETFGLAAVEAMALGCPLVCSDAGALPEVVRDGATGLLFRSGNTEELADRLIRLLDDQDLATRLGAAAAEECRMRFNPGRLAARTAAFYQRVLEGAGRPARGRR